MLLYEIRPGFKSSFQVQSWEVKFPDSLCLFYHQLKDVSYIFKSAEDTCISSHPFLPRLFPFPLVLVPLIFFFLSLPSLLYGFPPTVGISSHWLHVKEDKSSVSGRSRHASWRWWRPLTAECRRGILKSNSGPISLIITWAILWSVSCTFPSNSANMCPLCLIVRWQQIYVAKLQKVNLTKIHLASHPSTTSTELIWNLLVLSLS